jgi:hypothetical protein
MLNAGPWREKGVTAAHPLGAAESHGNPNLGHVISQGTRDVIAALPAPLGGRAVISVF